MIAQLSRFAGVGAAATLLHVAVALCAASLLGLGPQAANGAGFLAAVTLSYLGHGRLTFRVDLDHRLHAPRFIATALAGLVVSAGLTQAIAVWLGAPFALAMGVVAVAVPLATYLLCRIWVFAPPHSAGGP